MKNIVKIVTVSIFIMLIISCESNLNVPEKIIFSTEPDSLHHSIPSGYSISNPYPNPFIDYTKFQISIPATTHLTVIIQNPAGDLVKTLVSQNVNPGRYQLTWDATNNKNKRVDIGFYFATMKTPDFESSVLIDYANSNRVD